MLERQKIEVDLFPLYEKFGLGTTTYSPLCGGFLTGKYNDGTFPENSRATTDFGWLSKERSQGRFFNKRINDAKVLKVLNDLSALATELGYTQA